MADNNFSNTISKLFEGMEGFISSKTVVGDPINIGDTIILPLVDVSFGVGAGSFGQNTKTNAGGGLGGKIQPSCVLVINNDKIKLVNIKNQDSITKILDLVPDIVDKITDNISIKKQKNEGSPYTDEEKTMAKERLSRMIDDSLDENT